jgi:hypothetical protein
MQLVEFGNDTITPRGVTSTGDLAEMGGGGMVCSVDGAVARWGVSRIMAVNQTISVVCSHNGEAGPKSGLSFFPLTPQCNFPDSLISVKILPSRRTRRARSFGSKTTGVSSCASCPSW